MPRRKYKAEEIIQHLRTVELERGRGDTLDEAARKVGVTPQTIVRWQKEYGGLRLDQAKRLKELEAENGRFKKIVANQAMRISILEEVAAGNF
jgi:putative transposase